MYRSRSNTRAAAGSWRNSEKITAAVRNEKKMARQATQATRVLEILPPKELLMMNPARGKKGISQI